MNIELAKFLLQLLEFIVVGACSIYVYIANKNRVTSARITEMEKSIETKIDGHGDRITAIESRCQYHPSHHDLGDLHNKINAVNDKVSTISGKLEGVDSNLRLILSRITERGMK